MPENNINSSYAARENKLRRLAEKCGLRLVKSRKSFPNDGYMIVDSYSNRIEYGEALNLSLHDVEAYLTQD